MDSLDDDTAAATRADSSNGKNSSSSSSSKNIIPVLIKAYNRFLSRNRNLVPNQYQLLTEAQTLVRENGLRGIKKHLKLPIVKRYLDDKQSAAQFDIPRRIRPKHFQTMPVIKPGVYHVDHATFLPAWASYNDGHTGFIVYVENFTNRLFVCPCRSTNTESWTKALEAFLKVTHNVHTLCSDYDGVPSSDEWRNNVRRKYGIRWMFLRRLPKAFLAERYVGYVKKRLSVSLAAASQNKKKIVKRWVDMVQPLWQNYNQQFVQGTKFRRNQVTDENFETFLSQLKNDPEPEMKFHFYKAGPFLNENWNRRLFKFDLGQKVYVLKKTDPSVMSDERTYIKATVAGSWDTRKKFTIVSRQLRSTKNGREMIPVYSLKEFDKKHREDRHVSRHYYFYENQLKAAVPSNNI